MVALQNIACMVYVMLVHVQSRACIAQTVVALFKVGLACEELSVFTTLRYFC